VTPPIDAEAVGVTAVAAAPRPIATESPDAAAPTPIATALSLATELAPIATALAPLALA
jgi:hypothetical protein